jgi:PD-(D/E)XK nuclease superfamily
VTIQKPKELPFIKFDLNEHEHRISHSQLQSWQNCEKRWQFSYLDNIVPKKTPIYFAVGTEIHEWVGEYYRAVAAGFPLGSEEVAQHIIELMKSDIGDFEHTDTELENHLRSAQTVLRYIRDFSPMVDKGIKILGVEEEISVEFLTPKGRKVILYGIADLLIEQDRQRWVLDHKTSGQAGFWSENEILMDTQLPTYIAGLHLLGKDYFGGYLNMMNTYPYKDFWAQPIEKIFKRSKTYRTKHEQAFALSQYGYAVDSMLDKVENGEQFIRKMSKDCARCPYMDLCLLDMKGIDSSMQRTELFVQRKPRTTKPTVTHLRF